MGHEHPIWNVEVVEMSDLDYDPTVGCCDEKRKISYYYDSPMFMFHKYSWYNPLFYILIFLDLIVIFRWWVWHKRESMKASRRNIHLSIQNVKSSVESLRYMDNKTENNQLTPSQEHEIKQIERNMDYIIDELNLNDERIRFIDDKNDN